jgi:RimJ/RimL family protein N-acetyltransferase
MEEMSNPTEPTGQRLTFARFTSGDAADLAAVLSDPEVTRSIMANATTPEECLKCAHQRIEWHNCSWHTHGYGVWALRHGRQDGQSAEKVIGWCGLTPSSHGGSPELLYGLTRPFWGGGLATEAARSTIDWAFANHVCDGVDAIIFGPLNPGSAAVARKLGMSLVGKMTFKEFLPDEELGLNVLSYEEWRLREGNCIDFNATLFQSAFKAGLIVSAGVADAEATLSALIDAASERNGVLEGARTEISRIISQAFNAAINEPELDVYHLDRSRWEDGFDPR